MNDNLDDDDEFKDPFGDEETLKQVQAEILKSEEGQMMKTCRAGGEFLTSRCDYEANKPEE